MDFTDVLTIIGMLTTGAGTLWAVAKYLIDRMDKLANECHKRISDMTHRKDFDKHVDYIERQIESVREDIKSTGANFTSAIRELSTQLTTRLDNIMLALRKE